MARMFPSSIEEFNYDHISEQDVYRFLEEMLPANYYVFGNIRINEFKPDFVIIGPDLGLVVLEVKSWSLNFIDEINANNYSLKNGQTRKNPLEQAEDHATSIVNYLEKEQTLCQSNGRYKGNLKFCYSYGVVFLNIEKSPFLKFDTLESIDPKYILFKDDIEEIIYTKDEIKLKVRLKNMFIPKKSFKFDPLSQEDMRLIEKMIYKSSNAVQIEENTLYEKHSNTQEELQFIPPKGKNILDETNSPNKKSLHNEYSFKNKLNIKKLIIKLVNRYFKLILISILLILFTSFYSRYKMNIFKFVSSSWGYFNSKVVQAFTQNKEDTSIESKPIMTFNVESNSKGYGTHIVIKDGKKYLSSKSFAGGSIIEFYDNKKVIIYDSKSDKKEFDIENDVINLEVGNSYTKIYHEGEEYKNLKYFKYDFVNREIIEKIK